MNLRASLFLAAFVSIAASSGVSALSIARRSLLSKGVAAAVGISAATAVTTTAAVSLLLDPSPAFAADDFITTESGLQYKVIKEGTGAVPQVGQTVKAHYTGWLDGFDSIRKFDSSRDRGRPFQFAVGKGQGKY